MPSGVKSKVLCWRDIVYNSRPNRALNKNPNNFCSFIPRAHSALRVVIRNTSPNVTKIGKNLGKNLESIFFVPLNSSHDFLSMIFGFLMKFRIDVCIFFLQSIFFRNEKNIAKNFFWEKMRFFWQKQILRFLSIEKSFKIDFPKIDFKWLFNWEKSQNLFFQKKVPNSWSWRDFVKMKRTPFSKG